MKIISHFVLLLCICMQVQAQSLKPAPPPAGFKSQMAKVNGINIHYVIGGKGEPLVLVHGFGQNWYMWARLMPDLAAHFTVIAPDLRGVGESDKPAGGYDKKTMASDIHALVKQLGFNKACIAGHDIGLMVVYAYAAQYPTEVKKLALLDALIPGIEPSWSEYWAKAWWWGFFGWKPSGEIIAGKERLFLTNFWPVVGYVKDPFTSAEKEEFIRAYAVPGGAAGSFHWFGAFQQDVKDNAVFRQQKLVMPVLAMGGDHSTGGFLADLARSVAADVKEAKIKDGGHWLVQEQTAQVRAGLLDFFLGK
ncbi:MAG TPA: alpha/beta hydrolase [Puia sp.]|nr:alpha/beta hydrolase [Puia sp.]